MSGENRSDPRSSQEQERFPVSDESETVEAMPESVGNRLRRARKHRGLTQDALANLAGVDQTAISKQENGKMNMEGPTLMRVAGAACRRVSYKKHFGLRINPSNDP